MTAQDSCVACREGADAPPIRMALQPIVDLDARTVYAQEALVRGIDGASAATVLASIAPGGEYAFDQACRVVAIEHAAALNLSCPVSINFLPGAVYRAETCIRRTLAVAARCRWPLDRIVFEVGESEHSGPPGHLTGILDAYRGMGFRTAIDDFGAGFAGLNLLADFQPNLVKLDIGLIRGVDADRARRAIVSHATRMCDELGIAVVAEGVETRAESQALRDLGIDLQQGFLFARPTLTGIPAVRF